MRTLVCLFDNSIDCTYMHSYICIITPHLGTLAEACEGPDGEPNPKMELVDPSQRKKDQTSAGLEDARQAGFT
jgi:hypothetical protein